MEGAGGAARERLEALVRLVEAAAASCRAGRVSGGAAARRDGMRGTGISKAQLFAEPGRHAQPAYCCGKGSGASEAAFALGRRREPLCSVRSAKTAGKLLLTAALPKSKLSTPRCGGACVKQV